VVVGEVADFILILILFKVVVGEVADFIFFYIDTADHQT